VDGRSRYDLVGAATVVECKQAGTLRDLAQIERYLETLARESPGEWSGHIVVGRWADRGLRKAVSAHDKLRLWFCTRNGQRPILRELA
jgi:hypothetical protein